MLQVDNVHLSIGKKRILQGVSFQINKGEIIALIGHNGAGKSTSLAAILGLSPIYKGKIMLNEETLTGKSTIEVVAKGISLVPQLNNVFRNLTVEENLELGAEAIKGNGGKFSKEDIYELFPILADRRKQLVGTMSGGQRQMVAIGIGLMSSPSLLLLDEPSVGLQPNLVDKVMEQVVYINKQFGITILIVEQNITKVLKIADRAIVMSRGQVIRDFIPNEIDSEELWHLM
jgi:ABC-type branched-subunit amino acid transport system ATPase component